MITVVLPEIPSSLTETEGETLAELAADKVVLELGAWQGYSTVCMAQTARSLTSVDWHHGDEHAGHTSTLVPYLQNLQRYGLLQHVNVVVGRFENVLPLLQTGGFDLVFVDGQHDYESVSFDGGHALRLLRPEGGTIAFHDYGIQASSEGGGSFGVTRRVNELWGTETVGRIEVVDTLAIVRT